MAERNPKVNAGFLRDVVARKRREVEAGRERASEAQLRAIVGDLPPARPWADALRGETVRVIAEIKRRSPSAGALAGDVDPAARARLYESGGAAAISVLTDSAFAGALADLATAREATSLPALRKDFTVDPWQVWEARAAGADAVLLIAAALDDAALDELARAAREAGLGVLLEIHAADEIDRAVALTPDVVGVNARDLSTFEVSVDAASETLRRAREALGPSVRLVAESGIASRADVRRAAASGADAILVGERLMRASDPIAALADLVGVSTRDGVGG